MNVPIRTLTLFGALLVAAPALGAARERAIEQIPELMGRILESQEEIRERENEMTPVVERYDRKLVDSKKAIESASSEQGAAEALVDYVEAYASRLEAQEAGLRSIEPAVVRMRADARDLIRAAEAARSGPGASKEEQKAFFSDQFQGLASATGELAERLERQDEASTTGAVLHASWASHGALQLPIPELGPDGAVSFARKVEGLYARYQARSNQLAAEKRSVRRLLDLLIERQLAQRLDQLFAGGAGIGLGALLSGDGKSQDWQDLGSVVSRTLGLPGGAGMYSEQRTAASMERLDYFARGGHRD
jgi:DNA repair exonuclease SbcCD ATPase subunit